MWFYTKTSDSIYQSKGTSMTDQEALKLALEALEACYIYGDIECVMTPDSAICLQPAISALKERLSDPMREVQKLGQEIEQEPPQRTWIGLEGAEFGWFCHTDFLNRRKYTKKQRQNICNQLLSEAQSWDIEQYILMMMRGVCD